MSAVTDETIEAAAAALSLAITRTSVADRNRTGPAGCPLTADELRYLASEALSAASASKQPTENASGRCEDCFTDPEFGITVCDANPDHCEHPSSYNDVCDECGTVTDKSFTSAIDQPVSESGGET